ncbi:glycosyltransferase family 4 protein [Methanocaldococcus sp.]|uniref:glycosyltransferase family 4 protein n=1 Tax=Methanocaldococcus sp. TaxID=2152917 RepID=UPI002639F97E|nr:glycosyltransferase family 4 protein [Methanocaldococcus sp.]MCQ6254490.1 glycosyltransferase family 4 protein [Methanocaldococcus sp.]
MQHPEKVIWGGKHVIIVTRSPPDEIEHPTFGGSRLVRKLREELEENGSKCSVLSLHDVPSISLYFLRIQKKKYSRRKFLKMEKIQWFLSLLISLIGDFLARFDVLLYLRLSQKLKRINPDIVIYNGSFGAFPVFLISKKLNSMFVLSEHNVDYYFYLEKLNSKISKPFISLLKFIELSTAKNADLVLCFNEKDKQRLIHDGVPSNKILVWKFNIPQITKYKDFSQLPRKIRNIIKGKPVVCFLGADYSVNVLAVEHLIEIAKSLPHVIFLIVGSVGEKFKHKNNLPPNVIITGYVESIEPYLAVADIFVNPKITSDTGIEVKMFDYLKYGKPIISTEIGARGFEHYKNVIVVRDLIEMKERIEELCKEVVK